MKVTTEESGGVLSVRVEGRIDGSTVLAFQRAVERAAAAGGRAVIVDCAGLGYISSTGLRAVLAVAKAASRRDMRFALCALPAPVRVVFAKSGFDTIIAIHPSEAAARAALEG